MTLSFSGEDVSYYPAVWLAYLDGEQVAVAWTDNLGKHAASVTMRLDTTTSTNGRHELYVGMHSDYWEAGHQEKISFHNFRGGFERVVNIDNGHTLMDIAANYLHVYLRPGERTRLTCRQLFTDNTSGPCSAPLYTISDRKAASVSGTGVITAGPHPGFATITITDGAKITSVRVWVRKNQAVPHFSGSGQMLSSYRAGASLFVVSPFVLQPHDLKADPNCCRRSSAPASIRFRAAFTSTRATSGPTTPAGSGPFTLAQCQIGYSRAITASISSQPETTWPGISAQRPGGR